MENERQNLEESLRRSVRNDIVRRNQLRGPISGEAERMIDKCVEIEMENLEYQIESRPSYRAGRDYD
ncbi:MAG: hypothetical protein WCI72_03735 [archaeon]